MSSNKDKKVVTPLEACQILGISKNLCYEAIRRGEIPAIRIGKRLLVPIVALDQMLGINNHEPAKPVMGTATSDSTH